MKILVTGGCGFIASHIVDAYIAAGHEVIVLDDLSSGSKANLNPKAQFIECDITTPQAAGVILREKPEIINHHAAQINVRLSVDDPLFDMQVNIGGLLNLLDAAKQSDCKKVIFASSGGTVYGEQKVFPATENHPTWPVSPYGIAKLASEYYLGFYQQTHGIKSVCLRYANIYGPRQNPKGEAGVVAIFIQNALHNKVSTIFGDGKQTRDYVYVGDVVEANLLALRDDACGSYNIGTAVETDVNEMWRLIQSSLHASHDVIHGSAKVGETMRSSLDAELIAQQLGWKAQASLAQGIQQTIDWFSKK